MWFNKDDKIVIIRTDKTQGEMTFFTTLENAKKYMTNEFNNGMTQVVPKQFSMPGVTEIFLENTYGFKYENIMSITDIE